MNIIAQTEIQNYEEDGFDHHKIPAPESPNYGAYLFSLLLIIYIIYRFISRSKSVL